MIREKQVSNDKQVQEKFTFQFSVGCCLADISYLDCRFRHRCFGAQNEIPKYPL